MMAAMATTPERRTSFSLNALTVCLLDDLCKGRGAHRARIYLNRIMGGFFLLQENYVVGFLIN